MATVEILIIRSSLSSGFSSEVPNYHQKNAASLLGRTGFLGHFLLLVISVTNPKRILHAAVSNAKFSQEYQTVGLPGFEFPRQEIGRP